MNDEAGFAALLSALKPYLNDIVVIGGWAHRLYGIHPQASSVPFQLLTTKDADIAAPLRLTLREQSIPLLLKRAGFKEKLSGEEFPPFSVYELPQCDSFYAEFLVPQEGSEFSPRTGKRKVTAFVAGATAQRLRHLEILIEHTWVVELGRASGFPSEELVRVRVPHPAAYIIQKLLVLPSRGRKLANDILYVHDTLFLFRERLPELSKVAITIAAGLSKRAKATLHMNRDRFFNSQSEHSESAIRIARAQGRTEPINSSALVATCHAFLSRLFKDI